MTAPHIDKDPVADRTAAGPASPGPHPETTGPGASAPQARA
jgi:hypothetical protein